MLKYDHIKKIFFLLSPENAHKVSEFSFKYGAKFFPFIASELAKRYFVTDKRLEQNLFGAKFLNPVGLAAGFDKNATMIETLTALGFGHIEFGTITPKAQPGNPKPRLFRYPEFESIQNAMGFNNDGMEKVQKRVSRLYPFATPLGANIGKNKTTSVEDALSDYEKLIDTFKDISDYLVINISSPNTPGLRDLQNEEFIKELFTMAKSKTNKAVILKIAPDLEVKDAINICNVALENGADGIMATNTTIDYSLLPNPQNFGGISGKVLEPKSSALFEELAREFYGKTILISEGGIDSAEIAYKRIRAGASLIQIYSAFIFKGPGLNADISKGILKLMDADGFHHISEAIGADRK
ncbi:quinone-dependent dihydroorotate dehydrogenase [Sulfurospirillum arcachonense]|uniref:quinone-dependent dihydroorotate dehydrogenase n=1 Tax=Sulfurospirillum arcachonense TaxID=57666 RepID=UPI0004682905|nr:quinone-dependent dihydroorotate dehydrogenase [Sulfurospirillum arcachonense]